MEIWRDGTPLVVRDKPADLRIDPMPDTPHWRFWWFNSDFNRHHLVDHWAWYTAVADFGTQATQRWIASYAAISGAILLAGLTLGWRACCRPGCSVAHRAAASARRARPHTATAALTATSRRAETEP
ncbi:MAG: hypothetical protein U0232_20190 [Thermomicrobiales bacterium]